MSVLFFPGDPFIYIDENLKSTLSVIHAVGEDYLDFDANSEKQAMDIANAMLEFRRGNVQLGNIIYKPN